MPLAAKRWKAVLELWRGAQGIHASDVDAGWRHVCEELGVLLASHGGFALIYVKTVGGFFHGWMPKQKLEYGEGVEARGRMSLAWLRSPACVEDPYALKIFESAGVSRAFRTQDLAPSEEERAASPSYRLLADHGIQDRMMVAAVVSPEVEIHFGFDRILGRPNFSEEDREIAHAAIKMLGRTCRWLALAYGYYPTANPLTPRERQVLSLLLSGISERGAAVELGLTVGSLHQVVVRVYRKLGVQSRGEMMARWLTAQLRTSV